MFCGCSSNHFIFIDGRIFPFLTRRLRLKGAYIQLNPFIGALPWKRHRSWYISSWHFIPNSTKQFYTSFIRKIYPFSSQERCMEQLMQISSVRPAREKLLGSGKMRESRKYLILWNCLNWRLLPLCALLPQHLSRRLGFFTSASVRNATPYAPFLHLRHVLCVFFPYRPVPQYRVVCGSATENFC